MNDDDLPIIDAHHHLWDLGGPIHYPWLQDADAQPHFLGDQGPLRSNYLPADYRRDRAHHNVVKTVHVEAECSRTQQLDETRWLTALNAAEGLPNAIVAHAWFHTPDAERVIERQSAMPLVRGIRSKPVTRASVHAVPVSGPGTMEDPAWRSGLRRLRAYGLSWDCRVPTWHLEEAARACDLIPETPVVLNHTGFPWDRSEAGLAMWRAGMRAMAARPNVTCKLSCLCLLDGAWDYEDNRRIVLETIELFGVARCMFASNFPVDGLRVSFGRMFDDYKRMCADMSPHEKRQLFYGTAARVYRLGD